MVQDHAKHRCAHRVAFALCLWLVSSSATAQPIRPALSFPGAAKVFAPGIASTSASEVRLTISPDGRTALWFSRNRPGGLGGYDIWMSRQTASGWGAATLAPFNSPTRDFDPAFSPDGAFVYFCSDRQGGLGGDDIYRVAVRVSGFGFGKPEHLGVAVNSPQNEFAPMLSPDRSKLLFSSDRPGGQGRQDLYVARRQGTDFGVATPLAGSINTAADEFDATFLADSSTIVFARAANLQVDRVNLFVAPEVAHRYENGSLLPASVNDATKDSYGPMLDWSASNRLTFTGQRDGAASMELYTVEYRLGR